MNIGLYQSAASLSALERWQDAVAQNITSSQVTGYRKRTVEFSGQGSGGWMIDSDSSSSDSDDPSTPAVFPKVTNSINFAAGDTQPTGRPLDVAIQGDGFFQIQMPDGSTVYTRNGQFSERADAALMSNAGGQVLNDAGTPITLSPAGGTVTINPDGTILQGSATVGRIGVVKFANPQDLTPIAGGMFSDDSGSAAPTPVDKPNLLQGYVEASNVTPMREMVDLVLISRSYEANQRIIKTADEDAGKALDALG